MFALYLGMRRCRKNSLNVTGLFHKMWRGHNREHIFADNKEKLDYLEQLGRSRTSETEALVQWHSFNIMGNHSHESGSVQQDPEEMSFAAGIKEFGNWMRRAHSRFGAGYNKRHSRQGKASPYPRVSPRGFAYLQYLWDSRVIHSQPPATQTWAPFLSNEPGRPPPLPRES